MKKLLMLSLLLLCGTASYAQLVSSTTAVSERTIEKQTNRRRSGWFSPRYQGELNFGFATGGKLNFVEEHEKEKTDYSRPFIETIHGVRLNDYVFAGVGVGLQYAYGKMDPSHDDSEKWNTLMIPIYFNLKGYWPVTEDFAPYLSLSFGSSVCAASKYNEQDDYGKSVLRGKYYGEYALGIVYRKFNFSFGLQQQNMDFAYEYAGGEEAEKARVTSFFVKLGVKF